MPVLLNLNAIFFILISFFQFKMNLSEINWYTRQMSCNKLVRRSAISYGKSTQIKFYFIIFIERRILLDFSHYLLYFILFFIFLLIFVHQSCSNHCLSYAQSWISPHWLLSKQSTTTGSLEWSMFYVNEFMFSILYLLYFIYIYWLLSAAPPTAHICRKMCTQKKSQKPKNKENSSCFAQRGADFIIL